MLPVREPVLEEAAQPAARVHQIRIRIDDTHSPLDARGVVAMLDLGFVMLEQAPEAVQRLDAGELLHRDHLLPMQVIQALGE